MIVAVDVWVALTRPPTDDRLHRVLVDVPDGPNALDSARLLACQMVMGRADVVMATRADVIDVLAL